jgi:hypothetical protein
VDSLAIALGTVPIAKRRDPILHGWRKVLQIEENIGESAMFLVHHEPVFVCEIRRIAFTS